MSTATAAPHSYVLHHARLYDLGTAVSGRRVRALQRRLLARAGIAAGERVLDVGCGPGHLTLAAAQAAGSTGETLGIDLSSEMIALATQRAKQVASAMSEPERAKTVQLDAGIRSGLRAAPSNARLSTSAPLAQ